MTNAWEPILRGDAANEARAAIAAIADGLRRAYPDHDSPEDSTGLRAARRASLDSGRAGAAIFFAYLASAESDDDAAQTSLRLLRAALDGSDARAVNSLYST